MLTRNRVAAHVVKAAMTCVLKRDQIGYSQEARARWQGINENIHLPEVPRNADCSSLTTWLLGNGRIAIRGGRGQDIVNALRWLAGWTGSQIQNGSLHRHGPRLWKAGRTLCFYGSPHDISHVALYVGKHPSTGQHMVVSHGQESGPHYLPYNYRSDFRYAKAYPV